MSRLQLALNVRDIDEAVDFYQRLFRTEPAKRRPGYANFVITEPPLKLVLIEGGDARGSGVVGALNHLGVEVETPEEVSVEIERLTSDGFAVRTELETTCCYAVQDKVWVTDPDEAPWEIYTVLADAASDSDLSGDGSCCGTDQVSSEDGSVRVGVRSVGACC